MFLNVYLYFICFIYSILISYFSGLKLVKQRAELMQTAAENVQGSMVTVFLDPAAKIGNILNSAIEWCQGKGVEKPVCSVANYLYPNCRVLAGNIEVSGSTKLLFFTIFF